MRPRTCACRPARSIGWRNRLRADGAAGLVHGNHGRRPANRVDDALRAAIVDQALTTYAGLNPVHLAETLAEADPAIPSPRTVQRILAEAQVHPPRTRRPPAHRSRRVRVPKAGMLTVRPTHTPAVNVPYRAPHTARAAGSVVAACAGRTAIRRAGAAARGSVSSDSDQGQVQQRSGRDAARSSDSGQVHPQEPRTIG